METKDKPMPRYLGHEIEGYHTLEDHAREGVLTLDNVSPDRVTFVYTMGNQVLKVPMRQITGQRKTDYDKEMPLEGITEELLATLRSVPRV